MEIMNITALIRWCGSATEHLISSLEMLSTHFEFIYTSPFLMLILIVVMIFCAICACVVKTRMTSGGTTGSGNDTVVPESVNYHLTRECNYKCGFCFHTAKTSFVLKLEDAKRGLKLLRDAGELCRCCLFRSLFVSLQMSVNMCKSFRLHFYIGTVYRMHAQ